MTFSSCTSHGSIMSPQKSEAAIWQSFFFSCCRKLLCWQAPLLNLATKDVFHPQWLHCYLQEAATFPYLAPDKALCHSTLYHYQRHGIQGVLPHRWRAVSEAGLHIFRQKSQNVVCISHLFDKTVFGCEVPFLKILQSHYYQYHPAV